MKKLLMLLISCVLICSLFLCSQLSVLAVSYNFSSDTNDNHPHPLNTPLSLYYANSITNYTGNVDSSCAYISIELLLSYYDSYLSDSFIPENYDATCNYYFRENGDLIRIFFAPGITQNPEYSSNSGLTYYEFITLPENINNYFHFYLLNLGMQLGYNTSPDTTVYGLFDYEVEDLLDYYVHDIIGFTSDQITVRRMSYPEYSTDAILQQTKNNIDNNTPTIFGAHYPDGSHGHTFIPYSYVDDTFYFHRGSPNDCFVNSASPDFNHTYTKSIIWLEINEDELPHSCSNNYINNTDNYNPEAVCMCKFAFHPEHTHTGIYAQNTTLTHIVDCDYCNADTENHNSTYFRISATHHRSSCICGRVVEEIHMAKRGENKCMFCGALLGSGFDGPIILGTGNNAEPMANNNTGENVTHLTLSGIIILSDVDYDLLLSGYLTIEDIYRKVGLVYG